MTRILLVEDEPDLADPLAYLLRREGYEVEIAEDGPGALTAFREYLQDPAAVEPALGLTVASAASAASTTSPS